MDYMDVKIAKCVDCGQMVDPRAHGVHYEVLGFVEQRGATGGANNIRFKKKTGNVLCGPCSQDRINGTKGQDALF